MGDRVRQCSAGAVAVGLDIEGGAVMRPSAEDVKVYLYRRPVDMR